jgi:hypothetical protein
VLLIDSPELCIEINALFKEVSAPTSSYHVVLASAVPSEVSSSIQEDSLVWMIEEDGKTVYYDFNSHAGFLRNFTNVFFYILPIDDEL